MWPSAVEGRRWNAPWSTRASRHRHALRHVQLRRAILLLPPALLFSLYWGTDGVLWAGPVANGLAGVISLLLVRHEMNKWKAASNGIRP